MKYRIIYTSGHERQFGSLREALLTLLSSQRPGDIEADYGGDMQWLASQKPNENGEMLLEVA